MIKVGIYGATGYSGLELIKHLSNHPLVNINFATSRSHNGNTLNNVHPEAPNILLNDAQDINTKEVDVVFICLPHTSGIKLTKNALESGTKVIDLSADYRLQSPDSYLKWYNIKHDAPQLLETAVYGLSEINRSKIKNASLIANPGCYPTSILLPTIPLIRENQFDSTRPIIIDSKSGVSGAGRTPKQNLHFVEVSGNFQAYKIGKSHQHIPEMEEQIQKTTSQLPNIIFTPHLLPVPRGILSTIYFPLKSNFTEKEIRSIYSQKYAKEPFIKILNPEEPVSLKHVLHTNLCTINITVVNDLLIITSAIDNLVKGAAGQAIQNMNISFDIKETLSLI